MTIQVISLGGEDDEVTDQTDMIEWECPEVYEYCEVEL